MVEVRGQRIAVKIARDAASRAAERRPERPTGPAAMAMDCGEITFAAFPPAALAPTNSAGSEPMPSAVATCKGAKRVSLLTTEPVRKTPIHPMPGAMSGNNAPVAASADPIEEVAAA